MNRKRVTREEQHRRRHEIHRRAHEGDLRLPDAIKELRASVDLTQEEFARNFKLTRIQVSELERGKGNPTVSTLKKIAAPFGLEVGFVARKR